MCGLDFIIEPASVPGNSSRKIHSEIPGIALKKNNCQNNCGCIDKRQISKLILESNDVIAVLISQKQNKK